MYAPVPDTHRPGPYPLEHTRGLLIKIEIMRVKRNDNCQKTMTAQIGDGLCDGNRSAHLQGPSVSLKEERGLCPLSSLHSRHQERVTAVSSHQVRKF